MEVKKTLIIILSVFIISSLCRPGLLGDLVAGVGSGIQK